MKFETHYAQIVGLVVRMRREARGIGLLTMARKMGVSSSGWSRVETGDTTMTIVQLRAAAAVLNEKPSAILDDAERSVSRLLAGGHVVREVKPAKGPRVPLPVGAGLVALLGGLD